MHKYVNRPAAPRRSIDVGFAIWCHIISLFSSSSFPQSVPSKGLVHIDGSSVGRVNSQWGVIMRNKLVIGFLSLLVLLSFVACDMSGEEDNPSTPKYGSLKIDIGNYVTRSITPSKADLEISEYKITGTYSGSSQYQGVPTTFSDTFIGNTYTKENLIAGAWSITVDGLNKNKVKVMSKTLEVGIEQNKTSSPTVQLEYIYSSTTTGSLDLSITLPTVVGVTKITVDMTSVSSHLNDVQGNPLKISYDITNQKISGSSQVFSHTKTGIKSGEYNAVIKMYKNEDQVGLPLIEAVHIHTGLESVFDWVWDESFFDFASEVVMTPSAGTYSEGQTVSLAPANNDPTISIYYTLNGNDPTLSGAVLYTDPIVLNSTTTIKACAKKNSAVSAIASGDYEIQVQTPAVSVASGTYTEAQTVTITCGTSGATIYYNVGGYDHLYSDPLIISANTNLKVYAKKTGLKTSEQVSCDYVIDAQKASFAIVDVIEPELFIAVPSAWGDYEKDIPIVVPGVSARLECNFPVDWYLDGTIVAQNKDFLCLGTGTSDVNVQATGGHSITVIYNYNKHSYSTNYLFIVGGNGIGESGNSPETRVCTCIGQTGEAGGRIVYDKGHYSDGWRYMEMALESHSVGGAYQIGFSIPFSSQIGQGRHNTRILYETGQKTGADYCYQLSLGGHNDWFLPSENEILLGKKYVPYPANPQDRFGTNDVYYATSTVKGYSSYTLSRLHACSYDTYQGVQHYVSMDRDTGYYSKVWPMRVY